MLRHVGVFLAFNFTLIISILSNFKSTIRSFNYKCLKNAGDIVNPETLY